MATAATSATLTVKLTVFCFGTGFFLPAGRKSLLQSLRPDQNHPIPRSSNKSKIRAKTGPNRADQVSVRSNICPVWAESAPELDQNTGSSPAPKPDQPGSTETENERLGTSGKKEKRRERNEKPSGREGQLKRGKKKKEGKWRGREGRWKERRMGAEMRFFHEEGVIRGRKCLWRNEGRLIMFVDRKHQTETRFIPSRPDEKILIQTEMIYTH